MLIDPQAQRLIEPYLEVDERLLWVGRPDPKRMALLDLGSFGFGIMWTAFIVHFGWNWLHFPSSRSSRFSYTWDLPMLIFMVPFVGIGLSLLFSPLGAYLKARETIYAVTHRRVLIILRGAKGKVESYSKKDIGIIACATHPDGSGNLYFDGRSGGEGRFVGIAQVRLVETLLRDVFKRQ
jgi:hypothetical protein